jgi:hypothetical protein
MMFKFDVTGTRVEFDYTNWHQEDHHYVVDCESIEFGPYHAGGLDQSPGAKAVWVLNGNVVTRDGDRRDGMGPTRRRTFILNDIRNPALVKA